MSQISRRLSLVLLALSVASHWPFASAVIATDEPCSYDIVESMPELMEFERTISFKPRATHETLIDIVKRTKTSLKIASFYVSLTAEPERRNQSSAQPGLDLMAAIAEASTRGVQVEVVLDGLRAEMSTVEDVTKLKQLGDVKFLNMTKLLKSGVLHSKFLISDQESLYIGSSNFDWRSYTQIKEIGIAFYHCPVLATDLDKIFKTYQLMADADQVPASLPAELNTTINIDRPVELEMDNKPATLFMGGSPPVFNGDAKHWVGRTSDIDGLLHVINKARERVDISVMNYNARTFAWPRKFWPRIDNALRRAASERRVKVRLLFSNWTHIKDEDLMWYRSLNAIQSSSLHGGSIRVKLFQVPSYNEFQRDIPYARVKHDKYMVTDQSLYIGTSNWTPDYFISTCGVGVVIEPKLANDTNSNKNRLQVIDNMRDLFERDFNSKFATDLV